MTTARNISSNRIFHNADIGFSEAGIPFDPSRGGEAPPDGYVRPQIVDIHVEVLHFVYGIYRLTLRDEDIILDGRAEYFIFWRSFDGIFEELSDDARSVVFISDTYTTADRNVDIIVGVGDTFGNTHTMRIAGLKGNF